MYTNLGPLRSSYIVRFSELDDEANGEFRRLHRLTENTQYGHGRGTQNCEDWGRHKEF
jgi:hypothetical protein